MRHLLFFLAVLMTVTGCQLTPQKTDPLAALETIEGPQIIIAETSAVLSQFHLVAQGLFAASYADFGELKFDSADQNHHYILIDPSVTNQIQIREVNRAQWIALSK